MSVRPDMENMLEQFLYKKDSPIDIEEIKVPDLSWLRFKRLKETHLRDITNADVVGIRDQNNKFTPSAKRRYSYRNRLKTASYRNCREYKSY